jgi:hypothetical protein
MKIRSVERVAWTDHVIGELDVPAGKLILRSGFGSGLARRHGDGRTCSGRLVIVDPT